MKNTKSHRNKTWLFFVMLAIVISTLAFAFYEPRSIEQNIDLHKDILRNNAEDGAYLEPAQKASNTEDKTAEGTLEAISIGAKTVEVITCLELPNTESWIPDANIKIKGETIEWSNFILINSKDPATYTSSNRCFLITFPYIRNDQKKIHVDISVSLFQDNSIDLINNETEKKVKEKLLATHPEIDFEVVTQAGDAGGGASIEIKAKPANLTNEEAMQLITEAAIEKSNGEWEFTADVP